MQNENQTTFSSSERTHNLQMLDLWRCFQVWKRNILLTLLITLLAFLVSVFLTLRPRANVYEAFSTMYSTASSGYSLDEALQTTSVMRQYSEVITSTKVLDHAAELIGDEELTGEMLGAMVSVNALEDSSVLRINVRTSEPELAVVAANAVSTAFVSEISNITGQSNVHVLDIATDYVMVENGESDKTMLRILLTVAAFFISSGLWVVFDVFSSKIHSLEGASLDGEIELLGIIPDFAAAQGSKSAKKSARARGANSGRP